MHQQAYNLAQELKFAGKFNPAYSIQSNSNRYDRLIKDMNNIFPVSENNERVRSMLSAAYEADIIDSPQLHSLRAAIDSDAISNEDFYRLFKNEKRAF